MTENNLVEELSTNDMDGIDTDNSGRTIRLVFAVALGIVLASLIFVAGFIFGVGLENVPSISASPRTLPLIGAPGASAREPDDVDLTTFWEVWNTVNEEFYYDLPDNDQRIYGAINGMLDTLGDSHTIFIEPDAAAIWREDDTGEYQGIGAFIEEAPQGGVYIIRVIEGAPAEDAGLLAGDIVIAVDGEDVTGYVLLQSQRLIRGEAGTPVTLTIVREGEPEPLDITIIRGTIEFPTVVTEMLDDNIGYVILTQFNTASADRMEAAVRSLLDEGAESIILDLRNNPGGYVTQVEAIADMFLPDGILFLQRDYQDNVIEHTTHNGGIAEDIPLVILVNENSASASEILAGAVQDRERGVLIGETTFGKGSVQLIHELSDGSQLRVTSANWYTPNNNTIDGVGVTPDIVIEVPPEPSETDVQLERAIDFLQNGQ